MTSPSIVVQRPAGPAEQLLLLFHGVGAMPQDLVPLGRRLGEAFPKAFVVSVQAPRESDFGMGYQWFSVAGITEESLPGHVAQAMPDFLATVARWQACAGIGAEATALVGFSQGAIMALEAAKASPVPAGRVVALAGRFAQLPAAPLPRVTIHMIHGKEDRVMPYGLTVAAAERLVALGADVTADVLPFVGHEVPDEMVELMLERLKGYLPLRHWRDAMNCIPDR